MKVIGVKTESKAKAALAVPPECRLLVANMAKCLDDLRGRIYMCPSGEQAFQSGHVHFPAKYIACYVQAGAKYVGEIAGCVRINKSHDPEFLWGFGPDSEEVYIKRAQEAMKATLTLNRTPPRLIFLIDNLSATDLIHEGGNSLLASKVYFDITEVGATDVKDLAVKLRNTTWNSLPRWKQE